MPRSELVEASAAAGQCPVVAGPEDLGEDIGQFAALGFERPDQRDAVRGLDQAATLVGGLVAVE